jgi:hypothetical protein
MWLILSVKKSTANLVALQLLINGVFHELAKEVTELKSGFPFPYTAD